jgi:hypothetical protein
MVIIRRAGDTVAARPFTICFVANPVLEVESDGGEFVRDPIVDNVDAFRECANHAEASLFGELPNQGERLLAAPDISPRVRVVWVFELGLPVLAENCLVSNYRFGNLLQTNRERFNPFLAQFGISADVVFAVSASATHQRSTTWWATDDVAAGGVQFILDGQIFQHCHFSLIPGTTALHSLARTLVALHEFGHALSSYENGGLVDLYVDSAPQVNCKVGRPIPAQFAIYNGVALHSDPVRDSLGYEPGWESFHCELLNPQAPAVMDSFDRAPVPESCEHDAITRRFLLDRIRTKIGR